jgi:hypothetical protein
MPFPSLLPNLWQFSQISFPYAKLLLYYPVCQTPQTFAPLMPIFFAFLSCFSCLCLNPYISSTYAKLIPFVPLYQTYLLLPRSSQTYLYLCLIMPMYPPFPNLCQNFQFSPTYHKFFILF